MENTAPTAHASMIFRGSNIAQKWSAAKPAGRHEARGFFFNFNGSSIYTGDIWVVNKVYVIPAYQWFQWFKQR